MELDFTVPGGITLKEAQKEAIVFCYRQANAIISLQTGLGKTLTSCVLTRELFKAYEGLLACYIVPQKAVKAFKKELNRLGMKYSTWTSEGKDNKQGSRILIVTHTALDKYKMDIAKIASTRKMMCVVDEIHNFANPRTVLFKALAAIRKFFPLFYTMTACTTRDTYIETLRGLVRADEINTDDYVIVDGVPKKVLGVKINDPVDCYKITTHMGYELKASYNHPVYTQDGFKAIMDVEEGDTVTLTHKTFNASQEQVRHIPVYVGDRHKNCEIHITENMAKILGWVTGDGWVSQNGHFIDHQFREDERDIFEDIKQAWDEFYEVSKYHNRPQNKENIRNGIITYRVYSKAISQLFKQEGIGQGARNKRIPKCIMQSPQRIQAIYLRYLWGADGHIGGGLTKKSRYFNCSLRSSSIGLLRDVQLILKSFGISTRINTQRVNSPHDRNKYFESYSLVLHRQSFNRFRDQIGLLKINEDFNKFETNRSPIDEEHDYIQKIEYIEKQQTVAIEVEDHVHYTSGILTHNTTVRNDLNSLYYLANITRPGFFGTLEQFQWQYLNIRQKAIRIRGARKMINEAVGVRNPEALNKKLEQLIIFRQQEYNLEFHTINIPMEEEIWNRYRQAGLGLLRETAEKNWAVRLVDLQYAVDNILPNFEPLSMTAKEKHMLALVKKLFDTGNIPIIYCFYLEGINRVKELLERHRFQLGLEQVYIISGEVPKKERYLIEDKIKQKTVTIINKAGTESINLQKANCMIYYDLPWSIDEFSQSVGRITRTDTEFNKQHVFFLEMEGTIDSYRSLRIRNHAAIVEQVQGKQNTLTGELLISNSDMDKLRTLLLWCFKNNRPTTKKQIYETLGVVEEVKEDENS